MRLTILASLSILGFAMAASAASLSGKESQWETSYGPLYLTPTAGGFTGSYPDYGGELYAERTKSNSYLGYWFQPQSEVTCVNVRDGSRFWGRINFVFAGDRFEGQWAYCDEPFDPAKSWDGKLISGAPIAGSVRPATSAPADAPLTADIDRAEAWGLIYFDYGSVMRDTPTSELEMDFTCDGGRDLLVGWEESSNPDRLGEYNLALIHRDASGEPTLASLALPSDGSQFGFCRGPDDRLEVYLDGLPLTPAQTDALGLSPSCTAYVTMQDQSCDAIRLYWIGAETEGGPFMLDRN